MDIWVLLSIITKFALYAGVLFAVGTVFYTVLFETRETKLNVSTQHVTGICAAIGLVSTVADYCIQAVNLTGEAASMFDPEILGILWQTPIGTVFVMRFIGLMLILSGLFFDIFGKSLTAIGCIICLVSFTQIGHTTNVSNIALQVALLVHLIGIALWVGILLPLYQLSSDTTHIATTRKIAYRFGKVAMIFVPILLVAGGWLAFVFVGSFENVLFTGYGQTLFVKIGLVVGLLGFAITNKLRFVPALNAGHVTALKQLNRSVRFEITLVVLILAVTSILTRGLTLPGTP